MNMQVTQKEIDEVWQTIQRRGFQLHTRESQQTAKKMHEALYALTPKQQELACLAPLLLEHLFWEHCIAAVDYSAKHRVSELKDQARELRTLRKTYLQNIKLLANTPREVEGIKAAFDKFCDDYSRDLAVMWFSMQRALWKWHPDCPHDDMVAHAMIARCIIKVEYDICIDNERMVKEATGTDVAATIDACCAKAYSQLGDFIWQWSLPDVDRNGSQDVKDCMKVLLNRLNQVDLTTIEY